MSSQPTLYDRDKIYQMPLSNTQRVKAEITRQGWYGATVGELGVRTELLQSEIAQIITDLHLVGDITPRITDRGIGWTLREYKNGEAR